MGVTGDSTREKRLRSVLRSTRTKGMKWSLHSEPEWLRPVVLQNPAVALSQERGNA